MPTCSSTSWPVHPPACSSEELHPLPPSPEEATLEFFSKTKKNKNKKITWQIREKIKYAKAAEQELQARWSPKREPRRSWTTPGRPAGHRDRSLHRAPLLLLFAFFKLVVFFLCVINNCGLWREEKILVQVLLAPALLLPGRRRPLEPAERIAARRRSCPVPHLHPRPCSRLEARKPSTSQEPSKRC